MPIQNQQVAAHQFLQEMYSDEYFPDDLLDKGKAILLALCERIESEHPGDLQALYALTHVATEQFNVLEAEFGAAGSEIDTIAREAIGDDFHFIALAYGFTDADGEMLIATRDW